MTTGFDLEVENARVQYNTALQQVQDQEHNLDLARRIHVTSEIKFKSGLGSSFEVTQAQAGFYQAQGNLINAQYDLLAAVVALKKALGKP
jgi:outer membrane protein TolC